MAKKRRNMTIIIIIGRTISFQFVILLLHIALEIQRLAQSEQDPDRVQILEELAMYVEGIMPPQAFG